MIPGIYVSKTSAYAVLGNPKGISVSKTSAYAVLYPRLGYPASCSAFPGLTSSSKGRHCNAYTGSIPAYPGAASSTLENTKYLVTGNIPAYPAAASSCKGTHRGFCVGSISAFPKVVSHTYNYIGIPDATPGNAGLIDLIVPIDAVDLGLWPTGGGIIGPGMGQEEFMRSMFVIDTADYDGSCSYVHQIIAKNTGITDQVITLKRVTTYVWGDTITFASTPVSTITIPAGTSQWTFFQTPFTPAAGEHRYYWNVPYVGGAYSDVLEATGRVVIHQTGATKTLIWRPMTDGGEGGGDHANVGIQWSDPRLWGYYGPEDFETCGGTWYWNTSLYAANAISIVMECCAMSSYQQAATEFRLYDLTADMAVPGTNLMVNHGGWGNPPNGYVDRKEFASGLLTNGHLYCSQFRLYTVNGGALSWILTSCGYARASFGIRLSGISKCEVVWRVAKCGGGEFPSNHGSSRVRLDAPGGNTELVYAKNETCSAADFDYTPVPELDYWITDDGHLSVGDGSSATNIPNSNAHQDPVADLLPIFSADWKDDLVWGHFYCQRGVPAVAGGDANSLWTLICLGFRPITPDYSCTELVEVCDWEPSITELCNEAGLEEMCLDGPVFEELCDDAPGVEEVCSNEVTFEDINLTG